MVTDTRFSRTSLVAAAAAMLAVTGVATAGDEFNWDFEMLWDVTGDDVGPASYIANENNAQDNGNGTATMADKVNGQDGLWHLDYLCTFADGRPAGAASGGGSAFVTANIVVTNNSNSTQTFSLLMTQGTVVSFPDADMSGSVVGTVTDLTFDDATVAAASGGSIYTSFIDGTAVQSLLDDPFSQSAGGPLLSSQVGPASFGTPDPLASGEDLDNDIAIFLEFTLSAGDSASFTAIFEVVPAPAALALFAGVGLVSGRRRRRC